LRFDKEKNNSLHWLVNAARWPGQMRLGSTRCYAQAFEGAIDGEKKKTIVAEIIQTKEGFP
jgi:hypothetical protein